MKQRELALGQAELEEGFFSPILRRISSVTARDVLHKFEHDRGGAIDNFDRVRDGEKGWHAGPEWYDGLTYETITGISDLLVHYPDPVLKLHLDSYAARIAAAALRDENGYINTYTQLIAPSHRFGENGGNLRQQHELYNAGALVEAGVHHYRATSSTVLLDTAVRFARYLCSLIGPSPKKGYVPAHPLPELAMVELYRLFQEDGEVRRRYPEAGDGGQFLALSEFWVENRGHHCGLPDWEHWDYDRCVRFIENCEYGDSRPSWGKYAQDDVPVLEQQAIEGHAVRAALLYAGVAACACENGREDYLKAAVRVWESMALRRMHVTGGVGAIPHDEKFGADYELPHDAYLETCAAIAAIFYCQQLYLATGEARYADCLETILYNGALVGVSQSGDRYSYVNPLKSEGEVHRWEWNSCPCCPPMDLKLYGKLPQLALSYSEESLTVNLYLSGSYRIPGTPLVLRLQTDYPHSGAIRLTVAEGVWDAALRLRIPGWCQHFRLTKNGAAAPAAAGNGYAVLQGPLRAGDAIELTLELPVLLGFAHPAAQTCRNQAVLRRGPIIYCLEEADNPALIQLSLSGALQITPRRDPDFLGGATLLEGSAGGAAFTAIPYYLWDNRESGTMRVWLPTDRQPGGSPDWAHTLYHFQPAGESPAGSETCPEP